MGERLIEIILYRDYRAHRSRIKFPCNGTLHQGERGRIDIYAQLTMSREHKCQYARFDPDVKTLLLDA